MFDEKPDIPANKYLFINRMNMKNKGKSIISIDYSSV